MKRARRTPPPVEPEASVLRTRERKSDRLLDLVRKLALKEQAEAPQPFLSIRAAAERFQVSVSAVATVYRQLAAEGILGSIRGSHTLLRGRAGGRTLRVHGLIGIPVAVRQFVMMRDYRYCFLHTRDALFARGFATRCIFFEEIKKDSVITRLAQAKVDAVIWFLPDSADRETPPRLRDQGIDFVGVDIAAARGMAARYEVRRRNAIRDVLRDWQADPTVHGAVIVRAAGRGGADADRVQRLQAMAAAEQIDSEVVQAPRSGLGKFLRNLCSGRRAGVVLPSPAAPLLAWHAPDELSDLLQACRVALIDGPMDLPHLESGAEVDLVTTRWTPIAKRIADDVLTGAAFEADETIVFEAAAHLRVACANLAGDL